ncbi:MAG: hypothetical protein ACI9R7_001869, partial [Lysobacterales bacterium]
GDWLAADCVHSQIQKEVTLAVAFLYLTGVDGREAPSSEACVGV